jgi:hypothetical protein
MHVEVHCSIGKPLHHKLHMDSPEIGPGNMRQEADN